MIENLAIKKKNVPKKGTKKQQNLGVGDDEIKRAVAVNFTIDTNKRGRNGSTGNEPKMTR